MLLLASVAWIPALTNDFITTWDDQYFILNNPLIRHLDAASIRAIFTTPMDGAYVPLPVLTFALEYHLFGLDPFWYHLTNLLLHLGCTLLVFHSLRLLKLENLYAAAGALLFGIHPMHVESVAWITERKDLVYSLFFLASVVSYQHFILSERKKNRLFVFSFLFFILALFSKIQAVTLPLCLLLVDYYLTEGVTLKRLSGKIPMLILSLVFGVAGIVWLRNNGTLQDTGLAQLPGRVLSGVYALAAYMIRFVAPVHLSALYPAPHGPFATFPVAFFLAPLPVALAGFLVYRSLRRTRAILFGSLFFLVNLVFMLQVLAAGLTFRADRYAYLSYFGLCFIFAWALREFVGHGRKAAIIAGIGCGLVFVSFMALTVNRSKTWRNSETLWTDVIRKHPFESPVPYNNMGYWHISNGQWGKAIYYCTMALRIDRNDVKAYANRGQAFGALGQWSLAAEDCSSILARKPDDATAWSNRGYANGMLGRWIKSVSDCTRAIRINPGFAYAYANRGRAYAALGEREKAVADFTRALELDPGNPQARAGLEAAGRLK